MYERSLLKSLKRALSHFPILFLNGPRQSGKSTIAKWIGDEFPSSQYLTMDDLNILRAAQADPIGFVDDPKNLMILDEIQRAPDLFLPIKASVDRDRRAARFLLTGSANVLLLPNLADSLAGRMQIYTLYPLAVDEIEEISLNLIDRLFQPKSHPDLFSHTHQSTDQEKLIRRIATGGYPEVQRLTPDLRSAWFKGYITTLLQRDIRELAKIEGIAVMPTLFALLASRAATLLNIQELARTSGIAGTTLKRYLTLFETFFLIHPLPAWSRNLGKRLIKSPKLHLVDTALLCYLLGLDESGLGQACPYWGKILENYVVGEILKISGWSERSPQLYHYRTVGGAEVDLVLEDRNRKVVGIEIKGSHTIGKKDTHGLKSLASDAGDAFVCGVIFYLGDQPLQLGNKLYALPLPFGYVNR